MRYPITASCDQIDRLISAVKERRRQVRIDPAIEHRVTFAMINDLCDALREVTAVLRSSSEPEPSSQHAYDPDAPHAFCQGIEGSRLCAVCGRHRGSEPHFSTDQAAEPAPGFVRVFTDDEGVTVLMVNQRIIAESKFSGFGKDLGAAAAALSEELGLDLVRG